MDGNKISHHTEVCDICLNIGESLGSARFDEAATIQQPNSPLKRI